jgi:phosphonopyruvate decarboxylase
VIEPFEFHRELERYGLKFFTGVPDSLLKDLCAYITDHVAPQDHVVNANEGAAVAMAAGYHLGTGRVGVVYLQNSGLGNAINPLTSLADAGVYAIPMLLIIGWRGEPGVADEPQHQVQGQITPDLLDTLSLPYEVIGPETQDPGAVLARLAETARGESRPVALLVRAGTFAEYPQRPPKVAGFTRAGAVRCVLDALDPDDVLVSTTGMTSREVFAEREARGQGHDRDFLTVGSMGHASQVALGLAGSGRRVVCLDGDGAVIMHMGSLAIIGTQAPRNLVHVVINNAAHDSVGGQPTAAATIDLPAIALACGYRSAESAGSADAAAAAFARLREGPGPTFLEIKVASHPHTDAGRPISAPRENKVALMRALGSEPG